MAEPKRALFEDPDDPIEAFKREHPDSPLIPQAGPPAPEPAPWTPAAPAPIRKNVLAPIDRAIRSVPEWLTGATGPYGAAVLGARGAEAAAQHFMPEEWKDEPPSSAAASSQGPPRPPGWGVLRDPSEPPPESLRAPEAPPQRSASGAGASGPPPHDYMRDINADFNERLGAMEDERQGRLAGTQGVADAYGNLAEEQRGQAEASSRQGRANADEERAKIAEIEQLNKDYANSHIDPKKVWSDMSLPAHIAAGLGGIFAGIAGGPKAVNEYYDNIVNRSIELQKFEIQKKLQVGQQAENLLSSLRKTSATEQEADDKARAVLIGATMTEVQKAGAAAKGPIEEAQVRQLMADLKLTRDTMMAKAAAAKAGAAAGAPQGGMLEVQGDDLIQHGGQTYLITDKSWGDSLRNTLAAYDRLGDAIRLGSQSLSERGPLDVVNPWSPSVAQGEAAQAAASEAVAKLAGSRGVPPNIQHMVQDLLPAFGSRFAFNTPDNVAKAAQVQKMLGTWANQTMANGLAVPVDTQMGPGQGKNAGKLTYYARPTTPRQAPQAAPQQNAYGFQPGGGR